MYLKWLLDRNGERISVDEAKVLTSSNYQEIMKDKGWIFKQVSGVPTLEFAIMMMNIRDPPKS